MQKKSESPKEEPKFPRLNPYLVEYAQAVREEINRSLISKLLKSLEKEKKEIHDC